MTVTGAGQTQTASAGGSVTPRAMQHGISFSRMPRRRGRIAMDCVGCGSAAVTERPDLTAQGYRRFRCRDCGKQFNERSDGVLNRASLPSDIIAFVVFCRLRYRLTLRDLSEILLLRGFTVSHECVRQWEAKLLPVMGEALRKRRHGTDAALARAGTSTKVCRSKRRERWGRAPRNRLAGAGCKPP